MLPSLQMGQHSPQPVGMARSSSSKYISMRRVLLGVSTSGVLMEESLSPASSSSHKPDVSVVEVCCHWLQPQFRAQGLSCESWTCQQTISFYRVGVEMGVRIKADLALLPGTWYWQIMTSAWFSS